MKRMSSGNVVAVFISSFCIIAISSGCIRNDRPATGESVVRERVSGTGQLKEFKSGPLAGMNARFEQSDGWIGADGVYSVPLSPGRTLWLFDDTWVGSVRDGQ